MCFDKVLELNPTNSDAWYSRARTKVRKGDIDNGLADLEKAIQLDRSS
jgi:tetratricopeptide (TPR) repeat protein